MFIRNTKLDKKILVLIAALFFATSFLVITTAVLNSEQTSLNKTYTVGEIVSRPDVFINNWVNVRANYVKRSPICTLILCGTDNPCCNACENTYLEIQSTDDITNKSLLLCKNQELVLCERVADIERNSCDTECRINGTEVYISGESGSFLNTEHKNQEKLFHGRLVDASLFNTPGTFCFEILP